jgi:myosin-crossreactive antigen
MNQDWEELLPLLIEHGLLACDIRDDVKNYTFKINTWASFQTTYAYDRETLDMRRTRTYYSRTVCLGKSICYSFRIYIYYIK